MKKLDKDLGKIYNKNGFYYLEKIFDGLGELMQEQEEIKRRAKRHGFRIVKSNWMMEKNPYYHIQTIINDNSTEGIDFLRYVFKMKLKYMK